MHKDHMADLENYLRYLEEEEPESYSSFRWAVETHLDAMEAASIREEQIELISASMKVTRRSLAGTKNPHLFTPPLEGEAKEEALSGLDVMEKDLLIAKESMIGIQVVLSEFEIMIEKLQKEGLGNPPPWKDLANYLESRIIMSRALETPE